jgi:hypothetical protein
VTLEFIATEVTEGRQADCHGVLGGEIAAVVDFQSPLFDFGGSRVEMGSEASILRLESSNVRHSDLELIVNIDHAVFVLEAETKFDISGHICFLFQALSVKIHGLMPVGFVNFNLLTDSSINLFFLLISS